MKTEILRQIEGRRAEIAKQAELLKVEDAELAVAERALRRLLRNEAKAQPTAPEADGPRRGRTPKFGDKSQRELILEALANSKEVWMETAAVLSSVTAATGIKLPKKTVSPLLSVMRREGVILRKGRTIALALRATAKNPRRPHAA